MRDAVLHIYNSIGSVIWKVFLFGFLIYFVFMVVSIARRAFSPKEKVSEEEIENDINEQW